MLTTVLLPFFSKLKQQFGTTRMRMFYQFSQCKKYELSGDKEGNSP
jgi:hypothetical protein